MMNKRGQLSIVNIVFFVLLVGVAVVVSPILSEFGAEAVNASNLTGVGALIVDNLTTIFWLGIVITFFLYITPIRPQQYG